MSLEELADAKAQDKIKESVESQSIPGGDVTWTLTEERALVRKMDLRFMPLALAMMFLAYLDRGSISNARVVNIGTPRGEYKLVGG
ncbi:hypothetical protein M427DRAFT_33056 [Gonapodya prolifera JEL478]|uniref:Uncharacterized protein n=1 Tax=Gonapodya prolifera (strain JEL478) TaxID=1344416 RepID=A0A139ACW3_GONPJ|nr:hypothetical protein M427DRAFT_33056 [Gonapodya prolifera JEL478]|eukprot:KXS14617.1 hypothetical protein M427DRAFT_33056 [Gonapodya prolifera JEL478]